MLEIIKAIIYGIVEGITEWLPISSTGHLILVERLIPFQETSEGFFDMFDVVIHWSPERESDAPPGSDVLCC